MYRFTKTVLTVIAVSVTAIAAKLLQPTDVHAASLFSGAPTVGDFQDARTVEERQQLVRRIPVVRVQGG